MKLDVSILPIGMFLVFLVMKLNNLGVAASWSWWWITSPLWIPAITLTILFVFIWFFFMIFDR